MSLDNFIITVFCLVGDQMKKIANPPLHRTRGFQPKLSDEEVITMEIVGEFFGIDTDKGIWNYFKQHWIEWFPELGSRANFAKQAANLWQLKQHIQQQLLDALSATEDRLFMADGFPIPLCKFKRARRCKLFKGQANYGYCASKAEHYYGFKGNVVINSWGIITGITATAAHYDERESLWEIVDNISGLLIADKGLMGEAYQQTLYKETGVNLQTPLRKNMEDTRGKEAVSWLISTRRLVETVIGQLSERFHIQKVRARDLWHFTNRITRKVLAHTVAIFVNRKSDNPLQFEKLIA